MAEETTIPSITTIKLYKDTKSRLNKLRSYPKEPYDLILQKLLDTLTLVRINPERARAKLIGIDRQKRSFRNELKK